MCGSFAAAKERTDSMDIKTFKVERWMNDYEDEAVYNLGETCIDSITVGELLDMAGEDADKYLIGLKDKRLTYGYIFGSPDLLSGIASMYESITPEQVIPTHGAIGANHQVMPLPFYLYLRRF